jgi:hypothetical protein
MRCAFGALSLVVWLMAALGVRTAEPVVQRHEAAWLFMVPEPPAEPLASRLAADDARCQADFDDDVDVDRCLIRGLIGHVCRGDPAAARVALALFDDTGTVAGLLPAQDFDGAYRGKLRLEPRLPVHAHRRHLELAAAALRDFDSFFAEVKTPSNSTTKPTREARAATAADPPAMATPASSRATAAVAMAMAMATTSHGGRGRISRRGPWR